MVHMNESAIEAIRRMHRENGRKNREELKTATVVDDLDSLNVFAEETPAEELPVTEEHQIDVEEYIASAEAGAEATLSGNLPAAVEVLEGEIMPTTDELVREAVTLNRSIGLSYFRLGRVCHMLIAADAPQEMGYSDRVADFFQDVIGLHYRKARYLIGIVRTFDEAGLDENSVSMVGWSKAKELIDLPREKLVPLLESAQDMTVEELKKKAKIARRGIPDTTTEKDANRLVGMSFKFFEDQHEVVENALISAMEAYGTDSRSIALTRALGDWVINRPEAPTLESLRDYVSEAYGADIVLREDS